MLKVGVLGGSVCWGHGASRRGTTDWFPLFSSWMVSHALMRGCGCLGFTGPSLGRGDEHSMPGSSCTSCCHDAILTCVHPRTLARPLHHTARSACHHGQVRLRTLVLMMETCKPACSQALVAAGILPISHLPWARNAIQTGTLCILHLQARAFPRTRVIGKNGCVPGTTAAYMVMCMELSVERDVDLVFVDYALNDGLTNEDKVAINGKVGAVVRCDEHLFRSAACDVSACSCSTNSGWPACW